MSDGNPFEDEQDGTFDDLDAPILAPTLMQDAVRRDLERWGPAVADTSLAASLMTMARALDDPGTSATPISMLAAQFRMTHEALSALAPPAAEDDGIDELKRLRDQRRGA